MMKKSFLTSAASILITSSVLCIAPAAQAQLKIDPARGVLTMAPLLEKTTPAVVNIRVSSKVKVAQNPSANSEFFERFFGEQPNRRRSQGEDAPRERTQRSAGSGVIVDARKGYILTNNHVIDDADVITVILKDGREAEAELVGTDPKTDVALLKIKLRKLTEVKFADSDSVKVGDYVIAIGNSFGIGQSVTSGIVSALGRSAFSRGDNYQDYIQTDAAINQGNSGGALINSKGELVGMNTAILSRSGGSNGIGFAVPTNMISNVMNQLVSYGEVRRGRIGVTIQNISPDLQEAMGLKSRDGALVGQVSEDSAAEKAGLKSGDVIVKFNGIDILDSNDIRNAVGLVERGQRASISYIRDGKRHTTRIGVESAPEPDDTDNEEMAGGDTESPSASFEAFDGASFENIPADLDPHGGNKGVLITEVTRDSDAWEAGLRTDDIIRAVNNTKVSNLSTFKTEVAKKKGAVFLTVQKGRGTVFIAVR